MTAISRSVMAVSVVEGREENALVSPANGNDIDAGKTYEQPYGWTTIKKRPPLSDRHTEASVGAGFHRWTTSVRTALLEKSV